jgi:AAA family ATP:ADP antiporter
MQLTRPKLLSVAGLSALAFLAMVSYAIARPATESLFLAAHTSAGLPGAWLLVAGAIVVLVAIYNRFLARRELLDLYGATAAGSGLVLSLLLLGRALDLPGAHYLLYAWKDVYVVLLVEMFYSYANSVFPIHTARWIYGLFGLLASLGGICGNLVVKLLSQWHDTATALWAVPPLLLGIGLLCLPLARHAGFTASPARAPVRAGLPVVLRSSYLSLLLVLVASVQVVITLIDYQFNTVLEQTYTATDQRTGIIATVYGSVDACTILLNGLTGPVLRLAGVPLTLIAIPLLLGAGTGAFALAPLFTTAAVTKVASKCFDYSLFRAAKELLYIPLDHEERTVGKAVVDMATYRVAKAAASALLLVLVVASAQASRWVTPLTLVLVGLWLALAVVITRRFRRKVSRAHEMTSS